MPSMATIKKMLSEQASADGLPARQLAVLRMTGEGYTDSEIASKLVMARETVDSHKTRTVQKLRLKNRSEYRRLAFRYAVLCVLETGRFARG